MRDLGIKGATRGKSVRTTVPDESARQLPDLVKRRFYAPAPNRLWVSDLERHEALTNRAVMKGHRL
jgi:putative transposase